MAVDGDEGNKAEEQPGFVAQLQAILNVLPAYTWYAAPSGGLTFVNKRTGGLPWSSERSSPAFRHRHWRTVGRLYPVVASGRPGRSTQILVKPSAHGRGR